MVDGFIRLADLRDHARYARVAGGRGRQAAGSGSLPSKAHRERDGASRRQYALSGMLLGGTVRSQLVSGNYSSLCVLTIRKESSIDCRAEGVAVSNGCTRSRSHRGHQLLKFGAAAEGKEAGCRTPQRQTFMARAGREPERNVPFWYAVCAADFQLRPDSQTFGSALAAQLLYQAW